MQAWGDAVPAFHCFCAVCHVALSDVCDLLEQKAGSWQARIAMKSGVPAAPATDGL